VVADLSTLVKVQRTLAMLERYQQEHRPLDATLQAELERIKALEVRLRAVVKE
jgi:N-formylglutamate amidohydrolase